MALRTSSNFRAFRAAPPTVNAPAVYASTALRERLWNLLPISASLFLVSFLFWGPYAAPQVLAVAIVGFFIYWLGRSYTVAVACFVGIARLRSWKRTNWVAKYCEWLPTHADAPAWDWPRHMVIIPNYKEEESGLARTLESLVRQPNSRQLVVVMAMEDREPGNREKAARLVAQFRGNFGQMFSTHHPAGLPAETPGKGSNEAWAAREAYEWLIERGGDDLARYSITSCDADAVFHERHFEALNYLFLTAKNRYRTFWQPAIFNSNNIWDIPAPLRIMDGLSGVNRMSNLVLPGSVKFPTSCYSLSWQMLTEVDYWDEEVIPEDWHIFLKCCFTLGDEVHVEPLFLPLGNDCVVTDSYRKTLKAHYLQSVRHAWGASDIPYAWRASMHKGSRLSLKRKLLLSATVTKVHSLWVAQWYIVTMGTHLPARMTDHLGANMPSWWLWNGVQLPGPSWHIDRMVSGDFGNALTGTLVLSITSTLVYFCIFPLFAMIAFEYKMRGPRPSYVSRWAAAAGFAVWPLMAVITFFWASLPAVHAQLKLASGTALIYRVAEKGSRRRTPVAVSESASAEAYGAGGGS